MQNPLTLVLKSLSLVFAGRVHLRGDPEDLSFEESRESFIAFRKIVVDPLSNQTAAPGAILKVRFKFKNLSFSANRRLSLLPIPLILGQPGFRSKTWLIGEATRDFIGLYEFDTVEAAESYRQSLPFIMMRRRAKPGSITVEVKETGI